MIWKRAVVIGASGGIGAAISEQLRRAGTQVHEFARSHGDPASRIDITCESSIAEAAARMGAQGPLDLVFVATGMLHEGDAGPEKSMRDLSMSWLARNFAINAAGPALVAKHFLPLLEREGRPAFAALSARVGSIGDNRLGGWYGYRASKAALNMLIKSLSIELARRNPGAVCVALHPGTVDTPLSMPFQRNVTAQNLFDPGFAAGKLLDVLARLSPADSGGHFAWDGQLIEP